MTTLDSTFIDDTPSVHASSGSMLRELTYRYGPKKTPAGDCVRLDAVMNRPAAVASVLMSILQDEAIEVLGVLCLTTKHRIICWHEVSRGSLDSTVAHPREIFKAAILANAAAVIVAHNHPSGDPTPSPDDVELTQRLAAAGALMGVEVLDHIVIGDESFVSFRQTGKL